MLIDPIIRPISSDKTDCLQKVAQNFHSSLKMLQYRAIMQKE
nr:MAG TPA_asm: hypothetical protein [Caudoviricetes sp.]